MTKETKRIEKKVSSFSLLGDELKGTLAEQWARLSDKAKKDLVKGWKPEVLRGLSHLVGEDVEATDDSDKDNEEVAGEEN